MESMNWNKGKVRDCLAPDDAQMVLSLPLSITRGPDPVFWWPTANGVFSVKSGYWMGKLGSNCTTRGHRSADGQIWDAIWKMKAPPKLQHFIWRAATGTPAVKERLGARHIGGDGVCGVCGIEPKTEIHAIFECIFSQNFWARSNLLGTLLDASTSSFKDQLQFLMCKLPNEDLITLSILAWAAWTVRNNWVFN